MIKITLEFNDINSAVDALNKMGAIEITKDTPDPVEQQVDPLEANPEPVGIGELVGTPRTALGLAALGAAPEGELDADNLPWDARIHTEARTKMKNGTWKLRRSVDKDLVAQVKAELKGTEVAPEVSAAPVAPEVSAAPVAPAVSEAPAAPAVSAAPAAPAERIGYAQFINKVIELQKTVSNAQEIIDYVMGNVGVTDLNALAVRPDLIPSAYEQISAYVS